MKIPLTTLLEISNPCEFKVHLASWNGDSEPLDVFVRDRSEWDMWNSWRGVRDDFNRPYILSLIDFYPSSGLWLFGGLYAVKSGKKENHAHSYVVERLPSGEKLVGRLKVRFRRPSRAKALKLENYLDDMVVAALLEDVYSGEVFCGYENINHDFRILETVLKANRPDWKAALENVKGVYAIFDKSNGKKYVGSAYGEAGIWSRWSAYISTGHGWSDELTQLIEAQGIDYARDNFRITLLEYRPARTDDNVIIERESFWKEALISRGCHGYNKN